MTITPYASSPIFDEQNLPDALRKDHRTKDGTWGVLRVLAGKVRLVFIDPPSQVIVTPETPALIPPQATHFVELLGKMTMQVDFYRERPQLESAGKPEHPDG
jgi:tellurite resistance-related uncharacterized protein